ncbi:MarR family transcriptional regulator [Amycolatopsis sp. WAC 04169]|uniref:MarR family winged helix-turn-helix transcriptional regulator n=1 Tax=Amycolatopsis sp. WAC 04169 TaxID=2203197 RepID=UPI000F79C2AB|nr:MarR family winged helix-turn-helix transcriptional regulator [Amycolatopsis sp. WAC 04169]RSN36827.1 MarR family transcriptional regulator [Amycolatopsis sp. WAC 04169]
MTDAVADVERAMIAIRRSQARRSLSKLARDRAETMPDQAIQGLLDAVEAAEESGEPGTVTSLAAALTIDQPRASRLVARAVEGGFLRREAGQRGGRRAVLVLTETGRAEVTRMHEFRRSVFAEAMADWPDDDRRDFARLLTAFVRNYEAFGVK